MKRNPTDALIVVDIQSDFCPGGALPVNGGDAIVPVVNALSTRFDTVVFTRDWHPAAHCSFSAAPQFMDKSWPAHCVAGSSGAAFHPDLRVPANALVVSKGTDAAREAYSGFQGTTLAEDLEKRGVSRVFVCGLATDYCVKHTAIDAVRAGFETVVLEDAIRAVDVPPGAGAAAMDEMKQAGIAFVQSGDLP
ncbi:MAG TPA: nicotinamidase [Candidatus Hydrogenedentes bacterium]|nr:nicotinamidase [Candidatus Hydrogenedentota bacterium]HOS01602.1 nicotinamidase [Candidatus Hydrogenedentota bacterium]